MEKPKQGTQELMGELKKLRSARKKEALLNSSPILMLRGMWVFFSGISLLTLSLYGIYMAHVTYHYPLVGRIALTLAGVLVLVPAACILHSFFKSVGEAK